MTNDNPTSASIVLIDLPNIFNRIVSESKRPFSQMKQYFLEWIDMGLLAASVNPNPNGTIGTYIFYSDRAMGGKTSKINQTELAAFAARQNLISQVSAIDVGIPGNQCESYSFECISCKTLQEGNLLLEKGIDSTLITYLFDMLESWGMATIISHDADYVPAIRALRRKGKVVCGAGYIKRASTAMIRECFEYLDLGKKYLQSDLDLFDLLGKEGQVAGVLKAAAAHSSKRESWLLDQYIIPQMNVTRSSSWNLRIVFPNTTQEADRQKCILNSAKSIAGDFKKLRVHQDNGAETTSVVLRFDCSPLQLECLKRLVLRDYFDYETKLPSEPV